MPDHRCLTRVPILTMSDRLAPGLPGKRGHFFSKIRTYKNGGDCDRIMTVQIERMDFHEHSE